MRLSKKKLLKFLPIFGVIAGLVLILYPFLPALCFMIGGSKKIEIDIPYESRLRKDDSFNNIPAPIPEENRLVIPSIGVDSKIVDGQTDDALLYGVWHRPNTGDPVNGGNYVLTGHRFRFLPPNNTTFYNLDKLENGDIVIVYYEGKEYDYVVSEEFVVEPEQIEIEKDLGYDVLTLYTCTPLWTSTKRLVIRADPMELDKI